ncbi:hypothetical protein F4Z99_13005 [Candidatus Poribacteria bacterium]|nr:hypothetical protein [Candidatus Poribacteria bacterium]MYA98252.1 hypothetical protein [Candidatus Poribacteria bacterium]
MLLIQAQEAEASGVHWFNDHSWNNGWLYTPNRIRTTSKWHWHVWEPTSSIDRHLHWRNTANWHYSKSGHQNPTVGWRFPIWARDPYKKSWRAIHKTTKSSIAAWRLMNPTLDTRRNWLAGRYCPQICPIRHR